MEGVSPEQQLKQLEETYRKQRADLEQQMEGAQESMPAERETVSRVVEGAIQQHVPAFQAVAHAPVVSDELSDEDKAKVQGWVADVFTQGLEYGIKEAKNSDSPALIDAFHAALTGELHDRLVLQKKLEEVN